VPYNIQESTTGGSWESGWQSLWRWLGHWCGESARLQL